MLAALYFFKSLCSRVYFRSTFSEPTLTKAISNRCPLTVASDICWVGFLPCQQIQDLRPCADCRTSGTCGECKIKSTCIMICSCAGFNRPAYPRLHYEIGCKILRIFRHGDTSEDMDNLCTEGHCSFSSRQICTFACLTQSLGHSRGVALAKGQLVLAWP